MKRYDCSTIALAGIMGGLIGLVTGGKVTAIAGALGGSIAAIIGLWTYYK